ncbi:MAG: aconitase/3-isopropylmalate dehydratase large subunit family protein [Rhodothermales bacterium]
MTITEKILARHAGRERVAPGDNIWVDVDILMTHDVCGPPTIDIFKREFGEHAVPWDKEKLVIIPDHYIFTKNHHANRNVEILREFAAEHDLPYYYDPGTPNYKGVCHMALAEEGFNRPGSLLVGTDSHSCTSGAFGMFSTGVGNTDAALILGTGKMWVKVPETMKFVFEGTLPPYLMAKDLILQVIGDIGTDGGTYRALEFDGQAVFDLPVHERMTLTNMAIEAGGKNGIIPPDEKTFEYVRARTDAPFEAVYGDDDARFHTFKTYNVEEMEPLVAKPHSPDNKATVSEVVGTRLDRAYVGSCTGGKLEDFVAAARILKGQEVRVDTYIVPATTHIGNELHTTRVDGETLYDIFERAGCKLGQASCAACLGGPTDTFGRTHGTEVVISTTNRNFPGRMGSKNASVYLASPFTVAASAVAGVITDPREVLV